MMKKYTTDLVANAYYGIDDNIPSDQTAVVSLRDLLKLHATLAELHRFFHQPLHMQDLHDVEEYLGTVDTNGAFKLLSLAQYEIMDRMLPAETYELFTNGVLDSPESPYYFKERTSN